MRWCYTMWEPGLRRNQPSIEYLELYAVTVVIVLWAKLLKNCRVIIFCDNLTITRVINKKNTEKLQMQQQLEPILIILQFLLLGKASVLAESL